MIEFNYRKGSIWRKWDLHTHSDASDGEGTCSQIVDAALAMEISVLALTDHHTFKNIDTIKSVAADKGLKIISGIEFRTEYGQKSVHMIGLFPDCFIDDSGNRITLDTQALTELILNPLGLSETMITARGREMNEEISKEKAFRQGLFKVQVDFKRAADLIHKYEGLVMVHAGDKSNSIDREMKHEGTSPKNVNSLYESLGTVKEELFRSGYIDICEIKNENDSAEFYLSTFGKPSITASDSHSVLEVGTRPIWIKADPTFEGLRQILFEPRQRISFKDLKGDEKNDYQVIESIKFVDKNFQPQQIDFSENLTSIIGGKSTGKSILLRTMASAIDPEEVSGRLNEVGIKDYDKSISSFEVMWKDGQICKLHDPKDAAKKIIYIPQSYLNRLVDTDESQTSIDQIIKGVLSQNPEVKSEFDKLTHRNREREKFISNNIEEFFFLLDDLKSLRENIAKEGDKKGINDTITKLEQDIENLKKGSGLTDEEITTYKTSNSKLASLKDKIRLERGDAEILKRLRNTNLFVKPDYSDLTSDHLLNLVTVQLDGLQSDLSRKWTKFLDDRLIDLDKETRSKLEEFKNISMAIKPLEDMLKEQEIIDSKFRKLKEERQKLTQIIELEGKVRKVSDDAIFTLDGILESYAVYFKDMFESKEKILEEYPVAGDLKFEINIEFRSNLFNETMIEQFLNMKKIVNWKDIDLSPYVFKNPVQLNKDFKKIIYAIVKGQITLKSGFTMKEAIRKVLTNWFIYNFTIFYQGDDISDMSPGKKSFVLLKLLIELDESKCPILLDQPEDDLDNRSVYNDLVRFLKTKKLDRQIIIATHNPNVVVGSDSELVIVANQKGEKTPNVKYKFEYVSGAIEHSMRRIATSDTLYKQGIREHVCEVLEGGELAFLNRQSKYNLIYGR